MKIHSRHLHAPLRGIFGPNSVNVARYASLIGTKSPTKWDAQLTESNFQTRSKAGMNVWIRQDRWRKWVSGRCQAPYGIEKRKQIIYYGIRSIFPCHTFVQHHTGNHRLCRDHPCNASQPDAGRV
ncbi:MAG: DUF6783 domain-containing protein [Enterocloster aldenensis]